MHAREPDPAAGSLPPAIAASAVSLPIQTIDTWLDS
jgi:hypothetical protein